MIKIWLLLKQLRNYGGPGNDQKLVNGKVFAVMEMLGNGIKSNYAIMPSNYERKTGTKTKCKSVLIILTCTGELMLLSGNTAIEQFVHCRAKRGF